MAGSTPEQRAQFTCPECGGHYYGTKNPGDPGEQWVRQCNGFLDGKRGVRCNFEWPISDDAKYGLTE